MDNTTKKNCCIKTTERSAEDVRLLVNRLNRMEGQIRGIRGMVERNAYCTDILLQVSAVTSALTAFQRELLSNHIRSCVANGIKNGDDSVIDELIQTIQKI